MCTHQCGTFIVLVYNMTIRITVNSEGDEVVVYLAGRLSEDAIKEFVDTCDHIKGGLCAGLIKSSFY